MSKITNEQLINASKDEKNIAVLMHLGGIFFNFLPSLFVYFFYAKSGSFLKEEAREALNFELSFAIYYAISMVLIVLLIGVILLPILFIFNWVCAILAILALNKNQTYTFPFTIEFIK
jgi:uncharacterized protein